MTSFLDLLTHYPGFVPSVLMGALLVFWLVLVLGVTAWNSLSRRGATSAAVERWLWRLPLIGAPTLVIAGQYDRVVHPRASRALAQLIDGSRYLEIPRCGHAPFLSHTDEFCTALQDFIIEIGNPAPESATV